MSTTKNRRKGVAVRRAAFSMRDVYISITLNGRREGKVMVQPIEARGHKSICTLLDLQDWDAAVRRLKEIGVTVTHSKNKPVVSIEEVKAASKKWFKARAKR